MLPRQKGIDPEKVAIYIRWSTEDQAEGTTLEVQVEGCRHYLLSQGWTVRADLILIDDGQSGGTLNRPGLNRLRAMVARDEVDCVVVFKLDRLSRSVPDLIRLVLDEWDGHCCVRSAREALDTTSSQGKMFFYLLASFAEWERNTIRDRTYSGRLRRAQEGRSPGFVCPLGFRPGRAVGTVEVVPGEAEVVRRIFREYAAGAGLPQIARGLNADGIYSRNGRPWVHTTVGYLLRNPAYKGDLVWGARWDNRHPRPGEKSRYYREEPVLTHKGFYPAIVEPELWEQVQAIRAARRRSAGQPGRAYASPHLLSGLLRCRCGAAMVARCSRQGRRVAYYSCSAGTSRGICPCRYIRQEALDALVAGKLRDLYRDVTLHAAGSLTLRQQRDQAGLAEQAAAVDQRLGRLAERMDEIHRQYRDGVLRLDEFRGIKAGAEREMAELAQRRRALARAMHARARQAAQISGGQSGGAPDRWLGLEPEQRKQLLRQFVRSITAYRDGGGQVWCEVEWRARTEWPAESALFSFRFANNLVTWSAENPDRPSGQWGKEITREAVASDIQGDLR